MQIQRIELHNFRQFKDVTIDFSLDREKNITIIKGDNGSGKTSLAQAFTWCLYNKVDFPDKTNFLLNGDKANLLVTGESEDVCVVLYLMHNNSKYKIIRKERFTRITETKFQVDKKRFEIVEIEVDGNSRTVGQKVNSLLGKEAEKKRVINNILPEDLAKYFFFSGERMESIGKEVTSGGKSSEFVEAINGLTGLKYLQKALDHLNPNRSNSVIGKFNDNYSDEGSQNARELGNKINKHKDNILKIKNRIEEIKNERIENTNFITKAQDEIKTYSQATGLQKAKERNEREIKDLQTQIFERLENIFKEFNNGSFNYFFHPLLEETLAMLNKSEFKGKDIPDLNDKIIKYLLDNGLCICGTPLVKGCDAYNRLEDLLKYIPPESIGTIVNNFVSNAKLRAEFNQLNIGKMNFNRERILECDSTIDELKNENEDIEQKLGGKNVGAKVNELQKSINLCNLANTRLYKEDMKLNNDLGAEKSEISALEQRLSNISLQNINNRRIEIGKKYAKALYDSFFKEVNNKKNIIKENLQKYINENFQKYFNEDFFLRIDDNYRISVIVKDKLGSVGLSTGQGVAVIFAFLAAVIRITKENNKVAEIYPVIMDAPLSALDKTRIKVTCETIPKIADQIIVFIKDTDGNIADEYMSDKIGKRLSFRKKGKYSTEIE